MSMRFFCDRCGRPIPTKIERLKLVVYELNVRSDLCGKCSESLMAWIRHEPEPPDQWRPTL